MKIERDIAIEVFMKHQKKTPPTFGAYVLPEDWQIDAMIDFLNHRVPKYERYYKNSNSWSELSDTANRSMMGKHMNYDYIHSGYGFVKISGIDYRREI